MNLLMFALKNLAQRKVRTVLTCIGIGIAVCAVVAFVGVSSGFQTSVLRMFDKQGIDVIILRKGTVQKIASFIETGWEKTIAQVPGVRTVDPMLVDFISYEGAGLPAVQIIGCRPEGRLYSDVTPVAGRLLVLGDEKAIVLGQVLAESVQKKVGETFEVEGEQIPIVGIYQSSSQLESSSALMPLKKLQQLTAREGKVTAFVVSVDAQADNKEAVIAQVVAGINDLADDEGKKMLHAIDTKEHVGSTPEIRLVTALVWATSGIALLLGGIGILNTMTTSVTTRTREIGVLRAVGWRRSRVATLILMETMILCLGGAVVGAFAGVFLNWVLSQLPATKAIVSDVFNLTVIGWGFVLAFGAGLVGGIYPAVMAMRLLPSDALRHE